MNKISQSSVSIGKYPAAEICITLLQYYYPNIQIYVMFGMKEEYSDLRKQFFLKPNITVFEANFDLDDDTWIRHPNRLNAMAKKIRTPYFITMDDDAFMKQKGIIEHCIEVLNENTIELLGQVEGKRYHPYFMVVNAEFFQKNGLCFNGIATSVGTSFYDIGAIVYLRAMRKIEISSLLKQHIFHMGAYSYDSRYKNVFKYCDGEHLKITDFDLIDYHETFHGYLEIANNILSGKKPTDTTFFARL